MSLWCNKMMRFTEQLPLIPRNYPYSGFLYPERINNYPDYQEPMYMEKKQKRNEKYIKDEIFPFHIPTAIVTLVLSWLLFR